MNEAISRWIANTIQAVPGRCWRNAVTALRLALPPLAGAVYVEGWATKGRRRGQRMAFEHGWLVRPDDTIIDPTLIKVLRSDDLVRYYPAIRYTLADLAPYDLDQLPLVWQHGWGGMGHPQYAQACVDAWQECGIDMRGMLPQSQGS